MLSVLRIGKVTSSVSASLSTVSVLQSAAVLAGNAMVRSHRTVARKVCHSFSTAAQSGTGNLKSIKLTDRESLLAGTDTFLFDCDGVLWKGDQVVPKAPEVIEFLRKEGKKVFFVTNNSTKSRVGLLKKFDKLGFNVNYEEILSSSFGAAAYLKQQGFGRDQRKVYVVGEIGIGEELSLNGIEWIGGPRHATKTADLIKSQLVNIDRDIGAVVVGLDTSINYYKIQYAQLCLNTIDDCLFVATNEDKYGNLTAYQQWAGGGTMVGAIRGCTSKEPVVVGKPSSFLIDFAIGASLSDRSRVCMVGDRLDTDILFGNTNNIPTLLVLSGVTDEANLHNEKNEIIPKYFTDSVADLLR